MLIITCVFLIIGCFWKVQQGKNLILTGILKEKSPRASRRIQRFIWGVEDGAKLQNFRVRKKLYFPNEIKEFDAFEVHNLRSIDAFLLKNH